MNSSVTFYRPSWRRPCEAALGNGLVMLRRGATWRWQIGVVALILAVELALSTVVGDFLVWISSRIEIVILLGGLACWRWSWFALQSARAAIYRYITYPRLKREAEEAVRADGPVPEVTILAVTYKEKLWITQAVFESVFNELKALRGMQKPARVVVATGCDEDDQSIQRIYQECCASSAHEWLPGPPELVLLRGDTGKRPAIAAALREISASSAHPDGVVIFMDGDTLVQPGLLSKTLPLFRLKPEVSAVTTNEDGWVKGPRWFAEWISLRFGLRHRTMCSIALSGKLLCLTGRLSIFRASVTSDPSFLEQIERDSIEHWLWDSFDMLSGDDKSTWYWLAARGRRMLYVPDAMATTIEVIQGSAVDRAIANVRRWSGNSLRHSWRAFKLGPSRLGWFCWYSLLDQRMAIWTVLVGPIFALIALCAGHFKITAGYVLWVLLSRLAHSSISWWHGRRFSAYYLPLQVLSDWTIALTKVWVLFHPAKQAWMNRGARTLDTTKSATSYRAKTAMAHSLYGVTCAVTLTAIGVYSGFVPVLRDQVLFRSEYHNATEAAGVPIGGDAGRDSKTLLFGEVSMREEDTANTPIPNEPTRSFVVSEQTVSAPLNNVTSSL